MAHLRKRRDSWLITIKAGRDPVTGKRKRVYETVNGTKKEVEKRMHELAYEIENGQYIEPTDLTIKEFLDRWYQDYAENNLAPSTLEYYDVIINSHLVPLLDNIKISYLHAYSEKLNNGRLDGKEGGVSRKSVKRHYTVLNQALKYAVKLQVIDNNPADPITPSTPNKPEIQALTNKQLINY